MSVKKLNDAVAYVFLTIILRFHPYYNYSSIFIFFTLVYLLSYHS